MICCALALIGQFDPTGLNCNGMVIRFCHACGLSGEVTTLSTSGDVGRVFCGSAPWDHDQPAFRDCGATLDWLDALTTSKARCSQSIVDLKELLTGPIRIGAGEVDFVCCREAEVGIEPEGLWLEGVFVPAVVGLLLDDGAVHCIERFNQPREGVGCLMVDAGRLL